MLRLRDLQARARRAMQRVQEQRAAAPSERAPEEPEVRDQGANQEVMPPPSPTPLVLEAALPSGVRQALRELHDRGDLRAATTVACRYVCAADVAPERVEKAVSLTGDWLGPLHAILALGAREKVWSWGPFDGDGGPLREALAGLPGSEALALRMSRIAVKEGKDNVRAAIRALKKWLEDDKASSEAKECEREETSAPAPEAPENPEGETSIVQDLLELNINQCRGKRNDGWYVGGRAAEEVGQLFILQSKVPKKLREALDKRGATSHIPGDPNARADGTYVVRAGNREYDGVIAVDLERLREEPGFATITATFDSRLNPSAANYTVVVLPPKQPRDEKCPSCGAPMMQKGQVPTAYWVCAAKPRSCGFSVQADETGVPLPPETCEECGKPKYLTKKKKKMVYRHLVACEKAA